LQVTPYMVHVAFQADATLSVISTDTHQMTPIAADGAEEVQFVNIEVCSTRRGVKPFYIRYVVQSTI